MGKRKIELAMMLLVLIAAFFASKKAVSLVSSNMGEAKTVVIDVGHGGEDPGKVGIDGVLEKELNLQIAEKVRDKLESSGYRVVMTRETDVGLYEEGTSNKKAQDLQNRCKIIEETNPVCTVSIHQNSYTDSAVCGPQVFYYTHSTEGERLAATLQNRINENLAIDRPRVQKENSTYYILKRSESVTVIVECGFITNPTEAKLLADDDYQEKMAEAICQGIDEYVNGESTVTDSQTAFLDIGNAEF